MSCRAMHDRVQAYADDELGIDAVIEVEAHLERCASCRDDLERQRSVRRVVGQLYPSLPPPPDLERRVAARLRAGRMAKQLLGAALAVAMLAVVVVATLVARGDRTLPPEVRAALAQHRAAEAGAMPLALASSDVAEVNRWLRHEIPFFTEVPQAVSRGFTVQGAAAVELSGERAGYVLYQAGGRPISLFVLSHRDWPGVGSVVRTGGVEFHTIETGGERVVAWSHDPVSYLLVSDRARAPAEACGVCHSDAGARGAGDLSVGAPQEGDPS